MREFLVEFYVARSDSGSAADGAARARLAAQAVSAEGTPVRYVRTILVTEEETCFYLYEAESADAVREAARRAGLAADRVVEVSGSRADEDLHVRGAS